MAFRDRPVPVRRSGRLRAFVALVAVGILRDAAGAPLRRADGRGSSLLSGAAGMALVSLIETPPLFTETEAFPVYGANGAALGLLCAWLVDDRMAARRGDERENDLLGVSDRHGVVLLRSPRRRPNLSEQPWRAHTADVARAGERLPLFTRKSTYSWQPGARAPGPPRRLACWGTPAETWPAPEAPAWCLPRVHGRAGGGGRPRAVRSRAVAGAERALSVLAPQLQRVLAHALEEGGWFGDAHRSLVRSALAEADEVAPAELIERWPRRPAWGCSSAWRLAGGSPGNSTCKQTSRG